MFPKCEIGQTNVIWIVVIQCASLCKNRMDWIQYGMVKDEAQNIKIIKVNKARQWSFGTPANRSRAALVSATSPHTHTSRFQSPIFIFLYFLLTEECTESCKDATAFTGCFDNFRRTRSRRQVYPTRPAMPKSREPRSPGQAHEVSW